MLGPVRTRIIELLAAIDSEKGRPPHTPSISITYINTPIHKWLVVNAKQGHTRHYRGWI